MKTPWHASLHTFVGKSEASDLSEGLLHAVRHGVDLD